MTSADALCFPNPHLEWLFSMTINSQQFCPQILLWPTIWNENLDIYCSISSAFLFLLIQRRTDLEELRSQQERYPPLQAPSRQILTLQKSELSPLSLFLRTHLQGQKRKASTACTNSTVICSAPSCCSWLLGFSASHQHAEQQIFLPKSG